MEQQKTKTYIVTQRSWRDGVMYEPGDDIVIPASEPPSSTWLDSDTMDFVPEEQLKAWKKKDAEARAVTELAKKRAMAQKMRADVLKEKGAPAKEAALEKARQAVKAAAEAQRASDKELI